MVRTKWGPCYPRRTPVARKPPPDSLPAPMFAYRVDPVAYGALSQPSCLRSAPACHHGNPIPRAAPRKCLRIAPSTSRARARPRTLGAEFADTIRCRATPRTLDPEPSCPRLAIRAPMPAGRIPSPAEIVEAARRAELHHAEGLKLPGPLGPGLLSSGQLGTIVRDLQAGVTLPDQDDQGGRTSTS